MATVYDGPCVASNAFRRRVEATISAVANQPKAPHLSGARLLLFVLAYNLGNFLRRLGLPRAVKDWPLRSLQVKLIKMGGRLVRHARRLVFQLAEIAVPRDRFQDVLERIAALCPAPG